MFYPIYSCILFYIEKSNDETSIELFLISNFFLIFYPIYSWNYFEFLFNVLSYVFVKFLVKIAKSSDETSTELLLILNFFLIFLSYLYYIGKSSDEISIKLLISNFFLMFHPIYS